jgi:signal transduction histidine kinase
MADDGHAITSDVPDRIRALLVEAERGGCDGTRLLEGLSTACRELDRMRGQLSEATALLDATVASYRAFAYSVSHDLRAPLRAIDGFSRIIADRLGPVADDDLRRLLDIVGTSAIQMNTQLDGLLRLSRLEQRALRPTCVAMEATARGAVEEIRLRHPDRRVEARVGPLAPAVGDADALREVFVELLANAWKFTAGKELARVDVTSSVAGGEQVYCVGDDGVGFSPTAAGRLFTAFGRLHKPTAFPGLGIGLAVVRAIVMRHRGRVWAEGELDRGARFYFSLPIQPCEPEGNASDE